MQAIPRMKIAKILSKVSTYDARANREILLKSCIKIRSGNSLVKGLELVYHDMKILHFYHIGRLRQKFLKKKFEKDQAASGIVKNREEPRCGTFFS